MKLRVTFYGERDTIYSFVDHYDSDYDVTLGTFEKPFPNTEKESTAFGLLESFAQSDKFPPAFYEEEVVKINITLISEGVVVF